MMKKIYFDNAATTMLDKEVLGAMMPYMTTHFGNPSAVYSYGREARMAVENARKSVAQLLNVLPGEIIFTSCGTESNNMAILSAVRDLGCRHIITSPVEHHAVLHTVEHYGTCQDMSYSFVKLLPDGHIDLEDLERQLSLDDKPCLVSLMHGNNEIGNLSDIEMIGKLCRAHNCFFHSDCVQTVGHYPLDLRNIPVDFISASAHKFHGPKGTGILYLNSNLKINPLIWGGAQERNLRAGTENVPGIAGFAKALALSLGRQEADKNYIHSLKAYMMQQLIDNVEGVSFNGDAAGESLYTVLSASFEETEQSSQLLFHLDANEICASGGSACSSGTGSHVIKALNYDTRRPVIRFSFSRYNSKIEIDRVIKVIEAFFQKVLQE